MVARLAYFKNVASMPVIRHARYCVFNLQHEDQCQPEKICLLNYYS